MEIYVSDLQTSIRFWEPLLKKLGYAEFQKWELGVSFLHGTTYIVFVQVEPAHSDKRYHRKNVGLNHLAFHAASRQQVDEITEWMRVNGYNVLYEDRHPHASGQDSYGLFCEDPDQIKVEIVESPGRR